MVFRCFEIWERKSIAKPVGFSLVAYFLKKFDIFLSNFLEKKNTLMFIGEYLDDRELGCKDKKFGINICVCYLFLYIYNFTFVT
jgi:hypothetical protein